MLSIVDLKGFAKSVRGKEARKPGTYYGTVTRVDPDGTTWARFDGNESETPCDTTMACKPGDRVPITVRDHRATIGGNSTDPATSDATVKRFTRVVEKEYVKSTRLEAEAVKAGFLQADSAAIRDLEADTAKVHSLTADQLTSSVGYIGELTAGNVTAQNIVADHAAVNDLDANYARLDAANIGTAVIRDAWVDALMVQSGLIAHEGTVFTLDAIKVNATSITAGTIDVERLIVTVEGEKYMVHVDPQTSQPTYQKLDGGVIEDLTITADKIVAGAVTAEKITAENIAGSGGWINLRSGTFAYVNAQTGEGISWDGSHLSISGSVTVGGGSVGLSEVAANASAPRFHIDEEYSRDGATVTVTAHVMSGASEVTSSYPASCFAWYVKSESGASPLVPLDPATGYSTTLSRSDVGYGAAVVCRFTEPSDAALLTGDDDTLADSEGTALAARVPSGDYVRVADLEATATVFDTDSLMLVGSEEERLVSIATLKDVFGDGDYGRLSNKPSIEGVTLLGDKAFDQLGIFRMDDQGYDVPDDYTLSTLDINALWANAQPVGA